MKHTILIVATACALLTPNANVQAAPMNTKHRETQIRIMCQDKSTRHMMIRELMNTKEGKQEMARMLSQDSEFRSYYETSSVNPG